MSVTKSSKLFRNAKKVHGSIYPGPAKRQDLRYAALVDTNIKQRKARKREEEAVA